MSGKWHLHWTIRRSIRAFQVGALSLTIYEYGYQSGTIAYMHNSEAMDRLYMQLVLQQRARRLPESDKVSSEDKPGPVDARKNYNVSYLTKLKVTGIASNMIIAARQHVKEQQSMIHEQKDFKTSLELQNKYKTWSDAEKKLSGQWNIVVVEGKIRCKQYPLVRA